MAATTIFEVSNVLLTQNPASYLHLYVTGDQDEPLDLRFYSNSAADMQVANVSLGRVAVLPPGPSPYREIANHDGIAVLENLNALPRAFFVSSVSAVAGYPQARTGCGTR